MNKLTVLYFSTIVNIFVKKTKNVNFFNSVLKILQKYKSFDIVEAFIVDEINVKRLRP